MIVWLKDHWGGILAAFLSLGGLMTSPDVLNLLPAKYSVTIAAIGIVVLKFSRAFQTPGTNQTSQAGQ